MLFSASLLIPTDTSELAPARATFNVSVGVVRRVWVRWRWGCGNLCGCRILYHEFQLWPLSLNEWFPSTTESLEFEENIDLATEPLELVVEGYNEDKAYDHRVWVAVEVEREPLSERRLGFIRRLLRREREQ